MFPRIKSEALVGTECEFVWLNAEAFGPVNPVCHGKSVVILVDGDNEDHCCIPHAAYSLAEELCGQLGVTVSEVPLEAFKSLCSFFKTYLSSQMSPTVTQPVRSA